MQFQCHNCVHKNRKIENDIDINKSQLKLRNIKKYICLGIIIINTEKNYVDDKN